MSAENAPSQGSVSSTITAKRSQGKVTTSPRQQLAKARERASADALAYVWKRLASLEARFDCKRCKEPAPPLLRWPGDLRARDHRGPHTCGKAPWSR